MQAGTAVVTMGELQRNLEDLFDRAKTHPVYVTDDGELVGVIISAEMVEILDEAMMDRDAVRVAEERLEAIRFGRQRLVDEDEFWKRVGLKDG